MDIDVLKSLVAVSETGSFSRAATSLCVSQSAVSKRIRLLEEKLETTLLDRSGPTPRLTPAGRIVVRNAKAVLDICCRCHEELKGLRQQANLSFCCTPSFGISYLPRIVRSFMELHPDVTNFTISFDDPENIVDGLKNGTYHLAVVEHCDFFPIRGRELGRLADDVMVLVGSPALGITGTNPPLDELFSRNICVRSKGCCSRRILEHILVSMGRTLGEFNKVLTYDDLGMIIKAVQAGDGVGYVSRSVAEEHVADGSLIVYEVPGFVQGFYRSILVGPGFVPTVVSDDLVRIMRTIAA